MYRSLKLSLLALAASLAVGLAASAVAIAKPIEVPQEMVIDKPSEVPVFRFVNITNGKSFYTHSLQEIAHMRNHPEIWVYKEIGFWVKPAQ